jgi:hypothetical protein
MTLVHGSNLEQKEKHPSKYGDEISRGYLAEIRAALIGPKSTPDEKDRDTINERVRLLEGYKDFLDQQKYAEQFDSRSNLHSSVLEEFLYYLFRDLVADFGPRALIGKSHTIKDIFFLPPNYEAMIARPYAGIERKDHDFVIGVTVEAQLKTAVKNGTKEPADEGEGVAEPARSYKVRLEDATETHLFDIPAIAIECKTYLDKTMLEGSSRAAEELKARNPNSVYIVAMEWLKLTEAVNLRKYKVDQIYVFRKQKNTDREFRFAPDYQKNPIDPEVVSHLFDFVRRHLTADWEGGVRHGLERGWLL